MNTCFPIFTRPILLYGNMIFNGVSYPIETGGRGNRPKVIGALQISSISSRISGKKAILEPAEEELLDMFCRLLSHLVQRWPALDTCEIDDRFRAEK